MVTYIIRRLLWSVLLLFVVSFITFVMFIVLPSADPAVLRAGRQATLTRADRALLAALSRSPPPRAWTGFPVKPEALRAGTYTRTLTLTLSTTQP